MSPGKVRLLTGVSCVGTLVVFACGMLFGDVPRVLFPEVAASASAEFLYVLAFFTGAAALMLPFDLVGDILIPAAFESRPFRVRVWCQSIDQGHVDHCLEIIDRTPVIIINGHQILDRDDKPRQADGPVAKACDARRSMEGQTRTARSFPEQLP